MPGYNVYRADRHRHGDGVAIYAAANLVCKAVPIGSGLPSSMESLWLEVSASSIPSTTLVGCIYRPPIANTRSINSICDLIDQALVQRKQIVVCGDLNVNMLSPEHPHTRAMSEYITTCDLHQPIEIPTRITPNSASCLLYTSPSPRDS